MPLNHNCTSATKLELLPPPDAYHRSRGWAQTPARLWEQGPAAADGESQGMGAGKLGRNRARARHRTGDEIQHHPVYVSQSSSSQSTAYLCPRSKAHPRSQDREQQILHTYV